MRNIVIFISNSLQYANVIVNDSHLRIICDEFLEENRLHFRFPALNTYYNITSDSNIILL